MNIPIKTIFYSIDDSENEYKEIANIVGLLYDVTIVSSITFKGNNYKFSNVEDRLMSNEGFNSTGYRLIRKIYLTKY